MVKNLTKALFIAISISMVSGCGSGTTTKDDKDSTKTPMQEKLSQFSKVKLTSDISGLTEKEKQMLPFLFDAAKIMDELFWEQNLGDKKAFLEGIKDEDTKQFAMINYGPWEKLENEKPFIESYGVKPLGANFYPKDMTKEEFEKFKSKDKTSLYTLIQRNEKKELISVPYHIAYKEQLEKAAALVKKAAEFAEDKDFKKYLTLRAEALLTDNYQASDYAWMDAKTSNIDFVIGPIENYTDALFGYKAAFESFILIKDNEWSKKLAKYSAMLPELQKELPVDAKYKKDVPGSESDINVYDAVYYAGNCNDASKSIAINLPNDEQVQVKKGTRKLQLKNSMKAKFDKILMPIANMLINKNQLKNVKFDAFFQNVMFHEVAHGMGIKNTINNKGTVRNALKEQYSSIEEGKADILGLYIVTKLFEKGEIKEGTVMDNYVTFLAGIFRSVRFGAASAHGKANMVRFYYFQEAGAFTRDKDGTYAVNFDKMKAATIASVQEIITMQGDGNYDAAKKQIEEKGSIKTLLQTDLDRLKAASIPKDIFFEQGKEVLGLK
jgi:hypothetical protein